MLQECVHLWLVLNSACKIQYLLIFLIQLYSSLRISNLPLSIVLYFK